MGPDLTAVGSQTFLGGYQSPGDSGSPVSHWISSVTPVCRTQDNPEVVTQPQKWRKGNCRLRQEAEPKGRESQNPLLGLNLAGFSCWQDRTRGCAEESPCDRSPSVPALTCAVFEHLISQHSSRDITHSYTPFSARPRSAQKSPQNSSFQAQSSEKPSPGWG